MTHAGLGPSRGSCRLLDTGDDLEHGRFASPVHADQRNMLLFGQLEGEAAENLLSAERFGQVGNSQNCLGHGNRVIRRGLINGMSTDWQVYPAPFARLLGPDPDHIARKLEEPLCFGQIRLRELPAAR